MILFHSIDTSNTVFWSYQWVESVRVLILIYSNPTIDYWHCLNNYNKYMEEERWIEPLCFIFILYFASFVYIRLFKRELGFILAASSLYLQRVAVKKLLADSPTETLHQVWRNREFFFPFRDSIGRRECSMRFNLLTRSVVRYGDNWPRWLCSDISVKCC